MRALAVYQETGAAAFVGLSAMQGSAAPELSDPHYAAYVRHQRIRDASKSAKMTAPPIEDMGPLQRSAAAAAAASGAGKSASAASEGGLSAAAMRLRMAASVQERIPGATSALALFERKAYWSLRDMGLALGRSEEGLRSEVEAHCLYVRAGPHRGTYKLKADARSLRSAPAEIDDGIDDRS
jgi:hypothetical protein